jgi:HD-GYP domain-containing protein (c-di-GMP phosphodiesterase class II)
MPELQDLQLSDKIAQQLEQLLNIGIAVSSETDTAKLLDSIVYGAKSITGADGGTLYLVKNDYIRMEIVQSSSLGIALNRASNQPIEMPDIPLYMQDGSLNLSNVVSCVYHNNQTINIQDAYHSQQFDFSGTKIFDQKNHYRSKSFLAVPMRNHEGDTIGILQLINAIDRNSNEIVVFDAVAQRFTEALASQAATVLTKLQLIDGLEGMFETLIRLIATAIDEASPYTGGHCRRLPELTMMIAEAAHNTQEGYLKEFVMTDKDRYELTIASWLHDCGKITTPVYVIDKATKLETIFDRISLVESRFEILKRDAEITMLKNMRQYPDQQLQLEKDFLQRIEQLESDLLFIKNANKGGEFLSAEDQQRIIDLGKQTLYLFKQEVSLLTENEIYNLNIPRGTLTPEERQVINQHIVTTIAMLDKIPFPKHLKNVPEYACGHHERMDGKGYPNHLTREQLSIPARTMAIADIFEALTAKDRPYKEPKKLSEALFILGKMKDDQHIDPDLYDAFITQKVYLKYAHKFLDSAQIDIE